jgi:hypothetical protein
MSRVSSESGWLPCRLLRVTRHERLAPPIVSTVVACPSVRQRHHRKRAFWRSRCRGPKIGRPSQRSVTAPECYGRSETRRTTGRPGSRRPSRPGTATQSRPRPKPCSAPTPARLAVPARPLATVSRRRRPVAAEPERPERPPPRGRPAAGPRLGPDLAADARRARPRRGRVGTARHLGVQDPGTGDPRRPPPGTAELSAGGTDPAGTSGAACAQLP